MKQSLVNSNSKNEGYNYDYFKHDILQLDKTGHLKMTRDYIVETLSF